MPRRSFIAKREVLADPVYNSTVVTRLINNVMLDGKKGTAQKIVYGAFDIIKEKTGKEPLEVFNAAMANIMPVLDRIKIDDSVQAAAVNMIANPAQKPRMTRLAPIFNALFPSVTDAVRQSYEETHDPSEWTNSAEEAVDKIGANDISHQVARDMIQCAMTYYLINEVDRVEELERWSKMGGLV